MHLKCLVQWNVGVRIKCARTRSELLPARRTFPEPVPRRSFRIHVALRAANTLQPICFSGTLTAMRTDWPIGPNDAFQVLDGVFF